MIEVLNYNDAYVMDNGTILDVLEDVELEGH